MVYSKIFPYC